MSKALRKIAAFLIGVVSLHSCGYKVEMQKRYFPLSIAMSTKDQYGIFTNILIRNLNTCPSFYSTNNNARYQLKVDLICIEKERIGFRKDKEKDFTIRENIIASEGRLRADACIEIIDTLKCITCFGPKKISAYVDYDYVDENSLQDLSFLNQDGRRITVLDFSLGQLESEESARYAAYYPVFTKLAEKIVDVISVQ